MDVERLGRVDARRGGGRDQLEIFERPQIAEVEDRTEVDEERVVALAGKDDLAAGQLVHRGGTERCVVRCRARPNVARRAGKHGAEDASLWIV